MNKIKLMLTAVVVLSTVGGVLAFKASRDIRMCTTATKSSGPGQGTCGADTQTDPYVICGTNVIERDLAESGTFICTTAAPGAGNCSGLECPVRTRTQGN